MINFIIQFYLFNNDLFNYTIIICSIFIETNFTIFTNLVLNFIVQRDIPAAYCNTL